MTPLFASIAGPRLALLAAALCALPLRSAPLAPNVVEITPRLVTSGQPSRDALGMLKAQGYGAVVYLAPPTVPDAVPDEPVIVTRQGLQFVNIPIDFAHPTEGDFATFAAYLKPLAGTKVLVHCQVNLRASSMMFLYRTIVLNEDLHKAYEAVQRIWVPDATWKRYMQGLLARNGIDFEPF